MKKRSCLLGWPTFFRVSSQGKLIIHPLRRTDLSDWRFPPSISMQLHDLQRKVPEGQKTLQSTSQPHGRIPDASKVGRRRKKKRKAERRTDRGVNERWWRRARMNSNHEYISPRLLRPDRFSGGGARWSAVNTLRVVCGDGLMCEWMEEFEWIGSFVLQWIRLNGRTSRRMNFSVGANWFPARFCESAIGPLWARQWRPDSSLTASLLLRFFSHVYVFHSPS